MRNKNLLILQCIIMISLINSYAFADLYNGLIAYFPFNGNANDQSGNEYHGILNGATLVKDRFGKDNSCYSFENDNNIRIPLSSTFFDNDFTINVWVKFYNFNEEYPYILGGNDQFIVFNGYKGYIYFCQRSSSLYGERDEIGLVKSITTLDIDNWYCVTITKKQSTFSLFIDGNLETTTYSPENIQTAGAFINIGSRGTDPRFIDGEIDDIYIYNRSLDEIEIKSLYELKPETLSVNPQFKEVTAKAGKTTFSVSSKLSWRLLSTDSWITTQSDNNTITVNYDLNQSESRTAQITIFSLGADNSPQNIEIIQNTIDDLCNYDDSDNDGVIDIIDKCNNTSHNSFVDNKGCPINLNSYYTFEQLEEAIAEAITENKQIILQKETTINDLNNKINSMFSQHQLEEAISNAKKGLYNQEQVNIIINKILEWDTDNDGVIGLIEAIHALQMTTGVTPQD